MSATLQNVLELSFFVKRALMGALPMADEAERLNYLQALAAEPFTREKMLAYLAGDLTLEALDDKLRKLRRDVMLSIVARDVMELADYNEVVSTMSDLAEIAVSRVVREHALALSKRFGTPCSYEGVAQDFLVFGMGKLGGRELNVSSDIDLVFVGVIRLRGISPRTARHRHRRKRTHQQHCDFTNLCFSSFYCSDGSLFWKNARTSRALFLRILRVPSGIRRIENYSSAHSCRSRTFPLRRRGCVCRAAPEEPRPGLSPAGRCGLFP